MRFWIELGGVPIGTAELDVAATAVGVFDPLPAYFPVRVIFREGGNAFWDLLDRPRQSARGRRWRARLVLRMHRRAQSLALRTPSGMGVASVRVFLFDSTRVAGPPIAIVHFDEASAGVIAQVTTPDTDGAAMRPAA